MSIDPTRRKIALWGNFGTGNLGNECTLEAMLLNIRRYITNVEITCICTGPEDAALTHHIPAFPIRAPFPIRKMLKVFRKSFGAMGQTTRGYSDPTQKQSRYRWLKMLTRLKTSLRTFAYILLEPYRWFMAIRRMKGHDMLIITGLGMLGDFGIRPFGLHYDILTWAVIAKLCRCKLLFVSVGAGPLRHPVSRYFVKAALRLADYRSYRDAYSKDYMEGVGFDTRNDRVYPDLAFSLPRAMLPRRNGRDSWGPVIGVGLINYYDRRATSMNDETLYREYISKVGAFVTRLLERRYTVRVLIGDAVYDQRVRQDLRAFLGGRTGIDYPDGQIIDEPASSVGELLSQLASTNVVVSGRFHNLLLALMLGKPVVAMSYHEKFEPLLTGVGLREFCQDIEHIDVDRLITQLTRLLENVDSLKVQIARRTEAYRSALDEQYNFIFRCNLCQAAVRPASDGTPDTLQ
jgi:polysaccharide pyruvyl transferase WcaK-like protein